MRSGSLARSLDPSVAMRSLFLPPPQRTGSSADLMDTAPPCRFSRVAVDALLAASDGILVHDQPAWHRCTARTRALGSRDEMDEIDLLVRYSYTARAQALETLSTSAQFAHNLLLECLGFAGARFISDEPSCLSLHCVSIDATALPARTCARMRELGQPPFATAAASRYPRTSTKLPASLRLQVQHLQAAHAARFDSKRQYSLEINRPLPLAVPSDILWSQEQRCS